MKLFVAVVNYKRADLTIDCLASAVAQARELCRTHGATVIGVCENGSGDGSDAAIRSAIEVHGWHDVVRYTAIHPNLGFTGGNNAIIEPAIREHDPDYVLLLNNDTVLREGALRLLLEFLEERPEVGIAGSRLEDPDGTPQRSTFRFNTVLSEIEHGLQLGVVSRVLSRWVVAPPPPAAACRTDWVPGASMLIRREVLRTVGLLDEKFYTYFDDIDYCWNAARAGWSTWYVPQSRIVHLVGQTTGVTAREERPKRRAGYWYAARRRYLVKNYGAWRAVLIDLATLISTAMGVLKYRVQGRRSPWPKQYLSDLLASSVLVKGFGDVTVPNPALAAPDARTAPAAGAAA